MGRKRGRRRLLVGDAEYYVSVGHRHTRTEDRAGRPRTDDCREVVTLARLDGRRRGPALSVVFQRGPGRLVADGFLHDGGIVRASDDAYLNLHRPSVGRALLDEALERGWDETTPLRLDGWDLLDAVLSRLAEHEHEGARGRDAREPDGEEPV